ncbi:hypothetical protein Tco_1444200 [Tanacetum coccineum]
MRRGKGAHKAKASVTPKKTTKPKKKQPKRKLLIRDETNESEGEQKNRFQYQSGGSSEGAGTSPEVLDESKDKSETRDDLNDWGSTDDEEYLLTFKDKKPEDISWQLFTELERAVKELKQADHSTTILASIRSQVPSVVKEYLGFSLPDAFQKAVKEALEKTPLSLGQSSSQGQSHLTHDTHQELCDALTWSMLLDEATTEKGDNSNKVLKKRDRRDDQDEDPSAGSNQGKKTKKTRFNESKLSKNTSTTKESSKGISLARTSKSGKSVTAKESVKEPVFEIASDNVDQTLDDKVRDVG